MRTGDILTYLELLRHTLVDLFECELHLQTQITATVLLWTTCATTEATETVTSEDVAEHRENVVHVHRCTTEATEVESATHARTIETELVVLLTCLRIVQYIIGLCGLLVFGSCSTL